MIILNKKLWKHCKTLNKHTVLQHTRLMGVLQILGKHKQNPVGQISKLLASLGKK